MREFDVLSIMTICGVSLNTNGSTESFSNDSSYNLSDDWE